MNRYSSAIIFIAIGLTGCAASPDLAAVSGTPYAPRQSLTEARFGTVQPDVSRGPDVLAALGHPTSVGRVQSFDGPVWTWRYDHFGTLKEFHVLMDPQGVVRKTQMTEVPVGNDHHLSR